MPGTVLGTEMQPSPCLPGTGTPVIILMFYSPGYVRKVIP